MNLIIPILLCFCPGEVSDSSSQDDPAASPDHDDNDDQKSSSASEIDINDLSSSGSISDSDHGEGSDKPPASSPRGKKAKSKRKKSKKSKSKRSRSRWDSICGWLLDVYWNFNIHIITSIICVKRTTDYLQIAKMDLVLSYTITSIIYMYTELTIFPKSYIFCRVVPLDGL